MHPTESTATLTDITKVQYGLDDFVMYYPKTSESNSEPAHAPDTDEPNSAANSAEKQKKQEEEADAILLTSLAEAKAKERGIATENGMTPSVRSLDTQFGLPGSDKKHRALACNAFQGRYWSIAIRNKVKYPKEKVPQEITKEKAKRKAQADTFRKVKGFKPAEKHVKSKVEPNDAFFSVAELTDSLYELIFRKSRDAHGLIVIVGSTGSAKSQIMCGLLYRYLCDLMVDKADRRPHVITVEEPLEIFKPKSEDEYKPEYFNRYNLDLTPRQLFVDTLTLEAALIDALRQKPSAFAVDEVRADADWKALLNYANTGHLAITTAHAGSLDMGMNKILSAVEASHIPALRGDVGRRILGLVHIRREIYYTAADKLVSVLVPSLWRNTSQGIKELTASGLGSLLPNVADESGTASLGRSYFVDRLLNPLNEQAKAEVKQRADVFFKNTTSGEKQPAKDILKKDALAWDHKGD